MIRQSRRDFTFIGFELWGVGLVFISYLPLIQFPIKERLFDGQFWIFNYLSSFRTLIETQSWDPIQLY